MRAALLCVALLLIAAGGAWADPAAAPPAGNDPALSAPPPVPEADPSQERAKLLVQAIREDKPELARPFFFPQDAFRRVKAIPDPDRYFERLMKVYLEDVRAMRALLKEPDKVEFVSFSLGRQKRWVERGGEGNHLPYWANYKAQIIVRDGAREVALPLRVLITWDGGWYVTHLTRK
jgi:hypothetical protein